MTSYSLNFNEIITAGNFKNDFISFWNKETNTLHNDYMPSEVVLNATDLAIIKPQVANLQDDVSTLQTAMQSLNFNINSASVYIHELQAFFTHFKSAIYLDDGNNSEFNYDILTNGPPEITGNTALENEVAEIQVYITALKSFFNTFKENIYLSDANGAEIDYSKLT